jgi:hypothetical protein
MRVGVDFDRVLFNTEEFKDYLEEEIPGFLDSYGLDTGQGYDPEQHAKIMDISPDEIYGTLNCGSSRFLYEDIGVLDDLEKEHGHEVVIISRGDEEFQSTKIENAELNQDHCIVTGKSDENPKQLGENTQHPDRDPIEYLIDDREYEHENFRGEGFHLKRPDDSLEDVFTESGELINNQP